MTEATRGLWQRGRVVDDFVSPRRPRRFAWLFILGVLLIDAIIAAIPPAPTAPPGEIASAAEVRDVLRLASADPEPWLLIGDSVLVGDVMEGRVDGWRDQRVIDHLRRQQALDSAVSFHQVALDGMLPVDILRIVTELDRVDPQAKVAVAIELNPRYASPHYAAQDECTRPWLCELGIPVLDAKGIDLMGLAKVTGAAAKDLLLETIPIARHRARLDLGFDLAAVPALADRTTAPEPPDPLEARARLLEHYRDPVLSPKSRQIRALQSTVARLRAAGRRAVFFSTPVEDAFHDEAANGNDDGSLVARWAQLVDVERSTASLVNLDHPLFTTPLFLDHCHMGPEGNRRLALNLLHELGIGLADVPPHTEIVRPEGPDATLVSRIGRGDAEGAAWQAKFQHPRGLAVHPGADRVVIADTGNHCLRELRGNLQTVRTIAGACGDPGTKDGRVDKARLDAPIAPCFHRGAVYFATDDGARLRRYVNGMVSTPAEFRGAKWKNIELLRSGPDGLYLLDDGKRILRLSSATSSATVVVSASKKEAIRSFDVTASGDIFVVDRKSRIWKSSTARPSTVGGSDPSMTLVFANEAEHSLPQEGGAYFPFSFDELRLRKIVDLHWVERYRGLLVQDDIPLGKGKHTKITERMQLRFLSLEEQLVYPWLKPLVFGGGHITQSSGAKSLVGAFHAGSLAIDPHTASSFYLEFRRSRLFRFDDGLWGAAVTGNTDTALLYNRTREFFASSSGESALARLRPDLHRGDRLEGLPRKGPYLGVLVGSALVGSADGVGMYSLGRRLEQELQSALGYRDRVRLDLIVRSYDGAGLPRLVEGVETMIESSVRPDLVLVELRRTPGYFGEDASDDDIAALLQRLQAAVAQLDTMVVFVDLTATVADDREALRSGALRETQAVRWIHDAGFTVVDPGDRMLEAHLRVAPWSNPPFDSGLAAPWGVDATAEQLGSMLVPIVRERLRGRAPLQ